MRGTGTIRRSARRRWLGWLVGGLALAVVAWPYVRPTWRHPAPHLIPAAPGGVALRLAMVHDVLLEKYLRHGEAWHAARIAKRLDAIAAHDAVGLPWSDESLGWFDDAAISLYQIGGFARAERLLCRKLALLPAPPAPEGEPAAALTVLFGPEPQRSLALGRPLAPAWRQRYTTYANLAMVIIHGEASRARAGDAAALARVALGRAWLVRALAIDPGARSGREAWQLVIVDYLLRSVERPALLDAYDVVGNALGGPPVGDRAVVTRHGKKLDRFTHPEQAERALDPTARAMLRSETITPVGAEPGWREASGSPLARPVPFDEPTLALLDMWRYGDGPSPQLALALGGIMERVGQRYLAWEAYARALSLAEGFWGDDATKARLAAHCWSRQADLLTDLQRLEPALTQAELQRRFDREHAIGTAYQRDLQLAEAAALAAGADIDAPDFIAAFHAGRVIATPPGDEDWLVRSRRPIGRVIPTLVGLGLVIALFLRIRGKQA